MLKHKRTYNTIDWNNYVNGQNDNISLLYKEYYLHLILVAYKYVRCNEASKDIVSEVFNKLLMLNKEERAKAAPVLKANSIGFLTIMVKNKCIDYIRQKKNRSSLLEEEWYSKNYFSYNEAENKFAIEVITMTMEKLPPREKEILAKHFEGFKNDEIANELGISYNSVKNNIYEAKIKIKRILKLI